MTANQIAFNAHRETQRSNRANEQIQLERNAESKRHNLVSEGQQQQQIVINQQVARETARHNLASEDLGYRNLDLSERTLAETKRANLARESISSQQAQASLMQASAALQQAATSQYSAQVGAYTQTLNAASNWKQAQAATSNAESNRITAEKRPSAQSQAFANYGSGVNSYASALRNLADAGSSIFKTVLGSKVLGG